MKIRSAGPQDAAAIAAIWNRYVADPVTTFTSELKTAKQFCALMETCPFLVEELDQEVMGFATFGPFRNGPGYRHTAELTIYLDAGAQGRGLGRRLMQELLNQARAADIHAMMAGISAENPASIAFHQAVGFAEVARLPKVGRKAGRWLDLVLMQKLLHP